MDCHRVRLSHQVGSNSSDKQLAVCEVCMNPTNLAAIHVSCESKRNEHLNPRPLSSRVDHHVQESSRSTEEKMREAQKGFSNAGQPDAPPSLRPLRAFEERGDVENQWNAVTPAF